MIEQAIKTHKERMDEEAGRLCSRFSSSVSMLVGSSLDNEAGEVSRCIKSSFTGASNVKTYIKISPDHKILIESEGRKVELVPNETGYSFEKPYNTSAERAAEMFSAVNYRMSSQGIDFRVAASGNSAEAGKSKGELQSIYDIKKLSSSGRLRSGELNNADAVSARDALGIPDSYDAG